MRNILFIALFVALTTRNGLAQSATHSPAGTNVVKVTPAFINELAEEMRTNHFALRAAGARTNAAQAQVGSVRTWEDPTVRLGGMAAREPMRAEDGDIIYGAEQKLPLFGKPQLARRVAQAELSTEEANLDYRFQLLRKELAQAVLKTALADQSVRTGTEDLAWLETLTATLEQRFQGGQASQLDLLKAQTTQARRAEQLRTEQNRLGHERLALNRLLNRDLHAPWPVLELPPLAGPVPYGPRLVELALRNEPKIKVMRQEIRQAEARAQLTRRQRLPEVNVGVEARNYSGDASLRQGMVMLSMNFPWGNGGRYRNDAKREEARLRATEFELADYAQSVREEIHHLTVSIDAARREALLHRDQIIPRAEQSLANIRAAWESGRGLFADLLETRRMLLEARLMYARAVSEQYQAMSELVLCCGLGDLEALEMISAQGDSVKPSPHQP